MPDSNLDRMPVIVSDPATGEVLQRIRATDPHELDGMVARAKLASNSQWARREDLRREALARAGVLIEAHAVELAHLIVSEVGKPWADAIDEVRYTAARFRYYSRLEFADLAQVGGADYALAFRPIGVVGVITPWNYPLSIAVNRFGAPLLLGNTVVLKPSPVAPLAVLRMMEVLQGVFPAGVFQAAVGPEPLGEQLVQHTSVRGISFTGSTRTGARVATEAARGLKRTVLELGGNDPALVLRDADLGYAARTIAESAYDNCGQVCYCVKRVYVHESDLAEFTDALVSHAEQIRIGPGSDARTQLGPLTTPEQRVNATRLLADAQQKGARLVTGGTGDRQFLEPTVLLQCDHSMAVVAEEQFAPILPIVSYRNEEEALRLANDFEYGLGASVWTRDLDRGQAMIGDVESGTGWINCHGVIAEDQPHAATRRSGMGIVGGSWLSTIGLADLRVVRSAPRGSGTAQ